MAIRVSINTQQRKVVRILRLPGSSGVGVSGGPAFDKANSANIVASSAFDRANLANATANTALAAAQSNAYTRYEFTATDGQTTFSGLTYDVGYVDVYVNGAKISTTDFTATNGTQVILTEAASENDLVEIIAWSTLSISALNFSSGPVTFGYVEKTSDYTIDEATDYTIKCIANTFTVTLPTAANNKGQLFVVKNGNTANSSNNINVTTTGGETIDGSAPPAIIGPLSALTFISDNTNWTIV